MVKLSKGYEIVLIQEHHRLRSRDMETGPYIIAGFALAQRTVKKANGKDCYTTAGVAILVRENLYFERDRHIPQSALNWVAIKIRLKKCQHRNSDNQGNLLNIIASYTKHSNEYDTISTFNEVQEYIYAHSCPYI